MTARWRRWERYAYAIPMTVGSLYGLFVGALFGGVTASGFALFVGCVLSFFLGAGAYLGGRCALATTAFAGGQARTAGRIVFAFGTTIGVWAFCVPALLWAPGETWAAIAAIGAIAFGCSALYYPRPIQRP